MLLMALVMFPVGSLAASNPVVDVSDITGYTVISGTTDSYVRGSYSISPIPYYSNAEYTNKNGGTCTINIWAGNETILFENLTFGPGIVLDLGCAGGKIILKNCTFNGTAFNSGGEYLYTGTLNASEVVLDGNTINGAYRGFNIRPGTISPRLTATGNVFNLTPIVPDGSAAENEKNVGVQLSGDGNPWPANCATVIGNTFQNVTTALRLHSAFKVVSDLGTQTLLTFQDNTLINTFEGVGLHPSMSAENVLKYTSLLETNAVISGNTVNRQTEVKATVDPTYIVVIPSAVNFGKLNKGMADQVKPFSVSIQNALLGENAGVQISVNSGFTMKSGTYTLGYALYNLATGGDPLSTNSVFCTFGSAAMPIGNDMGATVTGRAGCKPSQLQGAGNYADAMTFTITYLERLP